MRMVFAGTPDYAVPSLRALAGLKPRHEVVAVVTQPDRPRGRSKVPQSPPVKAAALALGIDPKHILQPPSVNEAATLKALRELEPDLLCVVAYGGLLKEEALTLAKLPPLNAHGSLLPKYRGASPIQAAIMAGDEETGVSIMKMEKGLDSGPVMLQREIPIHPHEMAGTLHDRLSALSATCFLDAIRLLEEGRGGVFAAQDASRVSYARKLTKDSGRVDWTREAVEQGRFIRAMTPWPGAWTALVEASDRGAAPLSVRIAQSDLGASTPSSQGREPGRAEVTQARQPADGEQAPCFSVLCGDRRWLNVFRVQVAGGKEMSVGQFLNGAGKAYLGGGWFR